MLQGTRQPDGCARTAHHVDVLEAVVPLAWQTGIKAQGGEGTEHVLIQSLVIAVHVVADLQWQPRTSCQCR